jgi:hypothetical protein
VKDISFETRDGKGHTAMGDGLPAVNNVDYNVDYTDYSPHD